MNRLPTGLRISSSTLYSSDKRIFFKFSGVSTDSDTVKSWVGASAVFIGWAGPITVSRNKDDPIRDE